MKTRRKLRFKAAAFVLVLAADMTYTAPALAASPEFAYSAEKWAALRDDRLEFDEIADLVHEYNNTVIQNQIAYRDERNKTNDDVAQEYYDAANDIFGNIEYPDYDDSNYGSGVAAALNNERSAQRMMEQGDESTEDSETLSLGYAQTEANLVRQAQTRMISYWRQLYSMENTREQKRLAELSLQTEELRWNAGMSTQADVLTAREAVSAAEATILSGESELEQTKETLCLMLGWTYGASVEIEELPEPDMEKMNAIDLEQDIRTARENSYSLKLTRKRLANARTEKVRETQQQTLNNQNEAVAASVKDSYTSLVLAGSNYRQALQAYELEKNNMAIAELGLAAGTITHNAYEQQAAACLTAEVAVRSGKFQLLQAQVDYDWDVSGLASAS